MKKYLIEFIGTFFLVLTVALTGNPLAIGAVLTALVYMGGYISGAHYNPAVTTAFWITKKIDSDNAIMYIITQLMAAIFASFIYFTVKNRTFIPQMSSNTTFLSAFIIEAICTFLLCSVILHVAATKKTEGNNYYGIAIGFALMAIAFAGGPISGGAFNPAVGVGPQLFDLANISGHSQNILLYLIGPLSGGILSGWIYKYVA